MQRRSGRPYRHADEDIKNFIVFQKMHLSDTPDAGELAPFSIQRQVYLAFWGHLDTHCHGPILPDSSLLSPTVAPLAILVGNQRSEHLGLQWWRAPRASVHS
jgi:hypothetical protein